MLSGKWNALNSSLKMIVSSGNIAERSEKREIQERKQEMKDKFQMSVEDNSDFAKRIIVDLC